MPMAGDSGMNDSGGATTGERLHALDLVRAGALLLGIVFHAAIPFLPEFDLWLVLDQVRSRPVGWLTFTLHTFRMTTFFLLAGYFGRMLLVRRGASGFIRDRSKRILAPLVIFWLPVLLLYGLALALAVYLGATPAGSELAEPPALTVDAWPLMHLWFLYVLLILYAAVLIVRSAVAAVDRGGKLRGAVDRMLATALRLPLVLPLLLALPVMALLLNQPEWAEFWGIPTPEKGFVPNTAALGTYGLVFGLGWLVQRSKDGFAPLARLWAPYLLAALVLTAGCLAITDVPLFEPQLEGDTRRLFAALYAAAAWLWTFGLVGAALRFIRGENPTIRYLADSSYWLYIMHLPLLVALGAVVASWQLPAGLKLLLVVLAATAILLGSYHVMVRSTWLGALLNGKRYPRRAKPSLELAS